jgi:hypothetical protein
MISTIQLKDDLSKHPKRMAAAVTPWLKEITILRYVRFLDLMYHYTLKSGERLAWAAQQASCPKVKKFFSQLAREESSHYKLAVSDLKSLRQLPSVTEPAEVRAFHEFWKSITPNSQCLFLGSMYSLENVGGYLGAPAKSAIGKLGLTPEQARFVLVHLEADIGHGQGLEDLCLKEGIRDSGSLLEGATRGADFWIALHARALGLNLDPE